MPKQKQIGGDHYDSPNQPIDFIQGNKLTFVEGNIIKYVARYRNKNGLEDLHKAKWYLDYLIEAKSPQATSLPKDDISGDTASLMNVLAQSNEVKALVTLVGLIQKSGKAYHQITTTGRGGMWTAANLGYILGIPDVKCISYEKAASLSAPGVLFVDDICDTGKTISNISVDTAVLFNRSPMAMSVDKEKHPTYVGSVVIHERYISMPISQTMDTEVYKNV